MEAHQDIYCKLHGLNKLAMWIAVIHKLVLKLSIYFSR